MRTLPRTTRFANLSSAMGSRGWSIGLRTLEEITPASRIGLREATIDVLVQTWRAALRDVWFEAAKRWVAWGLDSLLTVNSSNYEDRSHDGEKATELSFYVYLTIDWPADLATHWLFLALIERRDEFEAMLGELGYAIARDAWYPTYADAGGRFVVVDGRIGLADAEGVAWQLPDTGYTARADLSDRAREAIERMEGPCACPYCERLHR